MAEWVGDHMDDLYDTVEVGAKPEDLVVIGNVVTVSGPAHMDVWPRWRIRPDHVKQITVEPRLADDGGIAFYKRADDEPELEFIFGVGPDTALPWSWSIFRLATSHMEPAEVAGSLRIYADEIEKGE